MIRRIANLLFYQALPSLLPPLKEKYGNRSLLNFFVVAAFDFLFYVSSQTLFAWLYIFQWYLGGSDCGRCFNNFSPTHNTDIRTERTFFKWLEFPFWMCFTTTAYRMGSFVKKYCGERASILRVSLLNTFSSIKVFQPNEHRKQTTKRNVKRNGSVSSLYASLFQHRIIWSNCTPSLLVSPSFLLGRLLSEATTTIFCRDDDEGVWKIIDEENNSQCWEKKIKIKIAMLHILVCSKLQIDCNWLLVQFSGELEHLSLLAGSLACLVIFQSQC